MKHLFRLLPLAALLLASCQPSTHFSVSGVVDGAEGKTLIFEQYALEKVSVIDSVKLGANGRFRFRAELPQAPEFYRLRFVGQRPIMLGVDSVAHIQIEAQYDSFGREYTVSGSDVCRQMAELVVLKDHTQAVYDSLSTLYDKGLLAAADYADGVNACLQEHKETARPYVLDNPKSPVAYFALYQRIHKLLIFDPCQRDDNRLFTAVATSWDMFYPHSDRSRNLVRLAMAGLGQIRRERQAAESPEIPIQEIDYLPYFEINLPNIFGEQVPLSSLEGNVILLDFTAFATDYSGPRTLAMRELYQKFEMAPFEIYQVSLDTDEHFWKTAALNLPWVCVRDRASLRSGYLRMYNVQQLPAYFLIDKQGHLVARDETISNLEQEIARLLRK